MEPQSLPTQASVVVIGGGVMGCSTLYHLARAGAHDAVLLERNELTSGTTWHSAAQVRALRSTRNMTELIRYSIGLYAELERETGQSTGWTNKGSLSIATTPERLTHIRRQEALARLFGVRARDISVGEAAEHWPLMNTSDVIGAVWSPDDGRVSPSDLCAALVKGARSRGAQIFEQTGVTGILTRGGHVTGVETRRGTIRCDAVALCTGLWSREAGAMAGAEVPVWPCEHFYLLTRPVPGIEGNLPTLSDHDSHLYMRDDSGGLLVGCFEPKGKSIDPDRLGPDFAFQLLPEDWDHFEPMMVNALHRLPVLEHAEVKTLLNGPESFTPDGGFLLGQAAETRGLYLGCGMNSVGVASGGGAGMALAHCITEGHMPFDLHEVDPARFAGCFNSAAALAERVPEVLGKHYEIAFPGRQWQSARNLRRLPLHDAWVAAGAQFGQVFGFERPLYFDTPAAPPHTFDRPGWHDQVGEEVRRAHESVAVFDQSSFGKIDVSGPDATTFLERLCTARISRPVGALAFTLMLNERGGIESDFTVIRLAEDRYRLMVGTGMLKRDLTHLRRNLHGGERVDIADVTEEYAILALMGPEAAAAVRLLGGDLGGLRFYRTTRTSLAGVEVLAARLSYVGEPGWELTCHAGDAPTLHAALADAGVRPAGLYAQTSMRIEKRFLAHGHDLDTDVTPMRAGLGFALDPTKFFIGADAAAAERSAGEACRFVTILIDDATAVPLGGEPVLAGGRRIGMTTSAAFGHRVARPLALAYLDDAADRREGAAVSVAIGNISHDGTMTLRPAFDPQSTRMRDGAMPSA